MRILSTLLSVVILVATMGPAPVIADQRSNSSNGDEGSPSSAARLVVPLTGTVAGGGAFSGSFSIAHFEERQGVLYAVGMVSGVVIGAPDVARSGISGPLALPVKATSSPPLGVGSALVAQATCDVLHLQLGGNTVNLLGLDVALSPVTLDLTGGSGPVGNLVCQIVGLLNNVAGVVGLLNRLLGVVGGLVGGLGA